MKYNVSDKLRGDSKIELEEYIPLKVIFDLPAHYHPSVEYVKGNGSMLELMIDKELSRIYSVVLLNCEDVQNAEVELNIDDFEYGDISVAGALSEDVKHIHTEEFSTIVYRNAVRILLEKLPVMRYVKNDKVIWGLNSENCLSQVIVELSDEEVKHLINEL